MEVEESPFISDYKPTSLQHVVIVKRDSRRPVFESIPSKHLPVQIHEARLSEDSSGS